MTHASTWRWHRCRYSAGDYKARAGQRGECPALEPQQFHGTCGPRLGAGFSGQSPGGRSLNQTALELDPNNAVAHAFYAEILVDQGTDTILRAVEESKVAQALAPDTLITHRARGYVLEATANYEEAVARVPGGDCHKWQYP